jgi:hypothetical protein
MTALSAFRFGALPGRGWGFYRRRAIPKEVLLAQGDGLAAAILL